MHLHRLRFSRSSVCQSPLLRLVGGCRLGLRAARPAPTGSATASRQAGTHHDSAFQLQYSYYRLRWSLRPSSKTHPFRRNGPRCERASVNCACSAKANRCRIRWVWRGCRDGSPLRASQGLGCQSDRRGPQRRGRGSCGSSRDRFTVEPRSPVTRIEWRNREGADAARPPVAD
jgi:hypothetical protein